MAAGAFVIGSATAPVEEIIRDGENGWLVDFFDINALAARVSDGLAQGHGMDALRDAARATVVDCFALSSCLAAQRALIDEAIAGASKALG